jgi:hypothetical protein
MGQQVCLGAVTRCTGGLAPSSLLVVGKRPMCPTPAANIMDNKPLVNILPFGMCNLPAIPLVDARGADQLASFAQLLERTLPLEEPTPSAAARERAAKARSERAQQLGAAVAQALPLLESSRYDIQVLAVLLRLQIEADGLDGGLDALVVVARMLSEGWPGLEASLEARAPRDRDKQPRKWARYVDAVFEQLHSWLARERERDERRMAAALAEAAPRWSTALDSIEAGLAAVSLSVGRFDAVERVVRDSLRAAEAAAGAAEGTASAAAAAPGGARPSSAPRASVRPAPASDGGRAPASDAVAEAESERERASATSAPLRVSPRFWELERRLAAFDALLARGEYEKAGIVESDLRESLEHFDVAAYFPGLFARYFEGCAAHAERLARHRPDRSALRASALTSLYRTDLERFLELADPSHPGKS